MNLRIYGLSEANTNKNNFSHCVSIADYNSDEHVKNFRGNIFKIQFNDYEVENNRTNRIQKQVKSTNPNIPQKKHIIELAQYFRNYIQNKHKDDSLMIHCFAGISRSSAVPLLS